MVITTADGAPPLISFAADLACAEQAFHRITELECLVRKKERAFSVAVPRFWNSLPLEAKLAPSLL